MVNDLMEYVRDAHGNRVLVGLNLEETSELLRITAMFEENGTLEDISYTDLISTEMVRWCELIDKHAAAKAL